MSKIDEALDILVQLDFPRGQHNERSALCLLALLDLKEEDSWNQCSNPLIGITPIMNFARDQYGKDYKPNTRETFRRQTMHQFVDAGIAIINPDDPSRPTNSPRTVYQIDPGIRMVLVCYGIKEWHELLPIYLQKQKSLAARYAKVREMAQVAVSVGDDEVIYFSHGNHSQLIGQVINEFAPRYVPGAVLIYAGDTGRKFGYFNERLLLELGVKVNEHGQMPDVILFYKAKGWLILVEAVTSHGPVDGKRHEELAELFKDAKAGLVYVTAFLSKSAMAKYVTEIAWETEVWVAEAPTHLIHFNGVRFLGPYEG